MIYDEIAGLGQGESVKLDLFRVNEQRLVAKLVPLGVIKG